MINISVDCDPVLDSPNEKMVTDFASSVLNNHETPGGEVTFIFGSDELLSDLKKEFFHKDQWTDVIAFRLNDTEEKDVEGEVYISLPRAKENAASFGEPFEKAIPDSKNFWGYVSCMFFDRFSNRPGSIESLRIVCS